MLADDHPDRIQITFDVTVQTCGDLGTIRPLVEGQPSTVFPLQTVSVPSNVNSYGVHTEIDLTTASRDVLIAIIVQQQAVIAELQVMIVRLERRVAELEGQAKSGGPPRMPGHQPSSGRKPPAQQQPRKQRRHGFARRRMTPTHVTVHV